MTEDAFWDIALEQAWRSFGEGNAGIGAVLSLVDGTHEIGRSQTIHVNNEVLSGSSVAHAEVDVLGKVKHGGARGGRLYSTLQPCLMCTGAALMSDLSEVFYLAHDPAWPKAEEMIHGSKWRDNKCKFVERRRAESTLALLLPLVTFAEKLTSKEYQSYLDSCPDVADQALVIAERGELRRMASSSPFDWKALAAWLERAGLGNDI